MRDKTLTQLWTEEGGKDFQQKFEQEIAPALDAIEQIAAPAHLRNSLLHLEHRSENVPQFMLRHRWSLSAALAVLLIALIPLFTRKRFIPTTTSTNNSVKIVEAVTGTQPKDVFAYDIFGDQFLTLEELL